jgi:branched-chain amino acid transport system permease protein
MLSQLLANALIAGSIYGLVALSFGLIYSTTRFFHFAHGGIYTWAAYLAYFFVVLHSFPLPLALFLAVGLTSLLGVAIEVGIYRNLRRKKVTSTVLLLCSLGILVAMQNTVSLVFGDSSKSLRSGVVAEGLQVLGARVTPVQMTIVTVSFSLCLLTWALMRFTRMGRLVRAVANDPELSGIVGVDVDRVTVLVFAWGSALAAVAAILAAFDTDMTPLIGFNALLLGVVAAVIGGIGSIPGSLLGGLLVGLAQHFGVWKLPTQWQDGLVFLILLVFLLIRPQGFLGNPLRKAEV